MVRSVGGSQTFLNGRPGIPCVFFLKLATKKDVFALKRTSLGSSLVRVTPCLEECLRSLAKLRLEEVWNSFTEHTKCVDVWLKNDERKRSVTLLRDFHMAPELS